jgi:Fe-S cluster assembly ATP-binding protein
MLKPKMAILDEIDSGLDVDALKVVADVINKMRNENFACLVVSHYARMYSLIAPTHVHVIINGKIVVSGDNSIITKIDTKGYEWIKDEYGIEISKNVIEDEIKKTTPLSLGTCAANTKRID